MISHKKGNVIYGLIIVILALFLFSMISILSYNIFNEIRPTILSDLNSSNYTDARNALNETYTRMPSWVDGAMVLILIGLWLGGMASVLMKDEHPVIFGVMMLALIFVIIAGAILGNFYEEYMQDGFFSLMPTAFPLTNWIMTHMLALGIVIGLSMLLVNMAKNRL